MFAEHIKKQPRVQQQQRQQKLLKTGGEEEEEEEVTDYSTRLAEMESELLNSELEPDEPSCKDSVVGMELGGKTRTLQAMDCEFEEVPLGWRREEVEEEEEEEEEAEGPLRKCKVVENTVKSVTGKRKKREKYMAIAKKLKVIYITSNELTQLLCVPVHA